MFGFPPLTYPWKRDIPEKKMNISNPFFLCDKNIYRQICDEQLFSWLTVQLVLFVGQIISACCLLQRQTMSTRNTLLDQRSKVLLLVFMLWTIIGVGFLGADNNTQESSCGASQDPVYNLAFKIIVFHVSVIGLYFLVRDVCSILPDQDFIFLYFLVYWTN